MFQKRMTMNFEYEEDKKYFAALLDEIGGLENNYGLFDFRSPDIKRSEFNKIRNSVFLGLLEKYGSICQLHCHEDCSNKATQVDHLIPLSSNILNKKIRSIKGEKGKKVPAQSFGSNHESNFVLACVRCNAYKKHGFPTKEILHYIIKVRNDKKT